MKKRAAALSLILLVATGVTVFGAESDTWYKTNEDSTEITMSLPCESEETEWSYAWINGEEIVNKLDEQDTEDKYEIRFNGAVGKSGYATIIAYEEYSGEYESLTLTVDKDGHIDVIQDGLEDALPLEESIELTYSDGAGAWGTEIKIDPDGSFCGGYHDSEMGETGEDYPEGTVYTAEFSGDFTGAFPLEKNVYGIFCDTISLQETGSTWIENGIRYIASNPAGLEGYFFALCLPDAQIETLDPEALTWCNDNLGDSGDLGRYAMYDMLEGAAFFSEAK
ncbi:MAG: hypothetical protein HUJ72_06170 [Blautia sp.]|nr:hypothetical protein [Blautia sp.]